MRNNYITQSFEIAPVTTKQHFDKHLPFAAAKSFVQKNHIQSARTYFDFVNIHNIVNLPNKPQHYYGSQWRGWKDFLGKTPMSFEDARSYVRSLNLKNRTAWVEFSRSGLRPCNIPSNPDYHYEDLGWDGWGDFLGNSRFLPFEEAREFVRSLGFKSAREYRDSYARERFNLPQNPPASYKGKWTNWPNFLGESYEGCIYYHKLSFEEARRIAHSLEIPSEKQWRILAATDKLPPGMPKRPDSAYKEMGWAGWRDFLNTKDFATYEEAKEFMRAYKFRTSTDYYNAFTNTRRPSCLPSNPQKYYKKSGWKGWNDFLSKES